MPGTMWSSPSRRTRRATRYWHACSAAIAAALLPAPFAAAQVTGTWNGSNGNWKDPLKWAGGVPGSGAGSPAGQGDVANFLKSTLSTTISLTDARTIGTLHFDSANPYTVSGTSTLSFNASSGSAAIIVTTANGKASTQNLNVPIRLNSPLSVNVASASASLTLNSSITDAGAGFGVTFDGPGTVTMAGSSANSYGGPTTVNAGTLVLSPGTVRIPGTLIIGNGSASATVRGTAGEVIADDADVVVQAGATSATNGGVLDFQVARETIGSLAGAGLVTGTGLVVAGSKSTTFSGKFQFGDFYKTGTSTLTLTGDTNHFVAFNLSGGTLVLGSDGALGTARLYLNNPTSIRQANGPGNVIVQATSPRLAGNAVIAAGTVTFDGAAPMTFGSLEMPLKTNLVVNADTTFTGVVSSDSFQGFTKSGPGTLTFEMPTYGGPTVVNAGTLKFANGSFGSSSSYILNGGILDVSAGGTNVTLAVKLAGVSSTVRGSLTVNSNSSISGTNLTLGDLKINTSINPALTGTLTAGAIDYGGSWQTIPAGTVIDGAGAVTLGTSGIILMQGEADKPFAVAGTLWGQGIIRGPVDVYKSGAGAGGSIGAGDGKLRRGILTTGDLTIESGATVIAAMSGTNGSAINVNGTIDLAGALSVLPPGSPIDNTTYLVLNNDGFDPINGRFSNLPNDGDALTIHSTGFDYLFAVNYRYDAAGDGAANDVALTMSVVPTPEPTAPALLGIAAMRLLLQRRRAPRS
ncbi:MAG: putative outer rane autotransporter barrel precursor [Phycisphaerales bacterium]|nr:putative outer rane autotransporter barrel precursor [Phycisphaerales bacterium]